MIRIAVDAMGGDHGVSVTVPASLDFLKSHPEAQLTLVGLRDDVERALKEAGAVASQLGDRVKVVHASEVVGMDEPPAQALRNKRDSSMRVAAKLVREGQADAFVSAGNTGALMAISKFVLKTLPGIDRPAIASCLPNVSGGATWMLDLGANVDCSAEHLRQFALMGAAVVEAVDGVQQPSIGLLNIGEEAIKGNEIVKQAAELLRQTEPRFCGNVEGDDIFHGSCHVVVCDGFVGNVALKTSEGLAQMIVNLLKAEFTRTAGSKLVALLAKPVLQRFKNRLDHRRYNGGFLVGLQGVVVKSHGGADAYAFGCALRRGYDAAQNGLVQRIASSMEATAAAIAAAAVSAEPASNSGPSIESAA